MTSTKLPMTKFFVKLILFGMLVTIPGTSGGAYEKKLLNDVLQQYNVLERPVFNESLPLNVTIGLTLLSILEVNIEKQYLIANIWMTLKWKDANLRWNSTDYGNITSLRIPPHRIWIPDIYVYNSLHPDFDSTFPTKVIVLSDGNVTYVPPGIFKSFCSTNAAHYPFDEQNCTLKFGSWTSHGAQIDLELYSENGTDLSSYISDIGWRLIGAPAKLTHKYYACCPEPYVDATFAFLLKRKGETMFFRLSLTLLFGATAMVFSFLIPPTSGQRIALGTVTFLAVLATGVSVQINVGKPTIMASYFSKLAIVIFLSILSNIFILYLYNINPEIRRIPVWLRKIVFDVVSPLILLNRPGRTPSDSVPIGGTGNGITENQLDRQEHNEELVSDLQGLILKMKAEQIQPYNINDWQYFATVLDRITFLFYLLVSTVFLIMFYFTFA